MFDENSFVDPADDRLCQPSATDTSQKSYQPRSVGVLKIQSANHWLTEAAKTPIAKMLFGVLWYVGELCFLFADMNAGKSISAMQVASGIADGKDVGKMRVETTAQKVLYVDTELSGKQFETRYSVRNGDYNTDHYCFPENLHRAEIRCGPDFQGWGKFEDHLLNCIEQAVVQEGYKVVIIDNLSYLGTETDKAHEALSLMKRLKAAKEKHGLSMLVLGHTKKRYLGLPLTENDLAGSKVLMNLADSAFAIGKSTQGSSRRYIKQMKERNVGKVYGEDSVLSCNLVKTGNFTHFEFLNKEPERRHLVSPLDSAEGLKRAAQELTEQGLSRREVSQILGKSPASIQNYLKSLQN